MKKNSDYVRDFLFQRIIGDALTIAKAKNPRISLRSFASKIGVNSGTLSQILNGKRGISSNKATSICVYLGLSKGQTRLFIKSLSDFKSRKSATELSILGEFVIDQQDNAEIIADPDYYYFLNLLKVKNFKVNLKWIANKLEISEAKIFRIISLLESRNLIERHGDSWRRTKESIITTEDVNSEILRAAHINELRNAAAKINSIPVELRDFSSITMPADITQLDEVKRLIRKFRKEISDVLEGRNCRDVYQLNIQLYPVSKVEI